MTKALALNSSCRAHKSKFIWTDVKGCFSFLFNDFGEKFTVHDLDGEAAKNYMVAHVTQEENGVITIIEDQKLELETGDCVVFRDIEGMTELNQGPANSEPYAIKVLGEFVLTLPPCFHILL